MNFLYYDQLSTLPTMCATSIGLAIVWGTILEVSKARVFNALSSRKWWLQNAYKPSVSMMKNFGYPSQPTDKFPEGITEPMARDFYAFLVTICAQHFISALPMLPVLLNGWNGSSEVAKSMFILGTLSDLGFDIYDAVSNTLRCFVKDHTSPLPIESWIIVVCMHHTTALSLVLPMNLNYVHRHEYHQTAFSLLMAAALCYGLGCYKFALDVGKKFDFYMYKLLVVSQLLIILYTRVYLWYNAATSFRSHLKEKDDKTFYIGASVMIGIFTLFNLILVIDGFKAAAKCLPKKFPKTKEEKEETSETFRRASAIDTPAIAAIAQLSLSRLIARRRFKGAVHSVIAANRMSSSMSNSGKSD